MLSRLALVAALSASSAYGSEIELAQQFALDHKEEIQTSVDYNLWLAQGIREVLLSETGAATRAEAAAFRANPNKDNWSADRALRAAAFQVILAASKKMLFGDYDSDCTYSLIVMGTPTNCWDSSHLIENFEPWADGSQEFYMSTIGQIKMPFWIWERQRRVTPDKVVNFNSLIDHGFGYSYVPKDPLKLRISSYGYLHFGEAKGPAGENFQLFEVGFHARDLWLDLETGEITSTDGEYADWRVPVTAKGTVIGFISLGRAGERKAGKPSVALEGQPTAWKIIETDKRQFDLNR